MERLALALAAAAFLFVLAIATMVEFCAVGTDMLGSMAR